MLSIEVFLSTLSLRRATQVSDKADFTLWDISIHALLAESDRPPVLCCCVATTISIHALLAESDLRPSLCRDSRLYFYPRSPCGERRPAYHGRVAQLDYFYPRSPCGERRPEHRYFRRVTGYFYPRSPCGERLFHMIQGHCQFQFLSTLSLRRATCSFLHAPFNITISIHALLAESDAVRLHRCQPRYNFYPRSPCGERRFSNCSAFSFISISIHALLAESDLHAVYKLRLCIISIHALLAESDAVGIALEGAISISIHALLAESDTSGLHRRKEPLYFYPRSPCGERQTEDWCLPMTDLISIHALLAESDGCTRPSMWGDAVFLSTLSLRRATISVRHRHAKRPISIHALLAESDNVVQCAKRQAKINFYPRSPCGERRSWFARKKPAKMYFYPRSPCGERPHAIFVPAKRAKFLSTLSLRRATTRGQGAPVGVPYFYPRSPCGERQTRPQNRKKRHNISIHALLAESDLDDIDGGDLVHLFLSTLSLRRATACCICMAFSCCIFLSTLSLRRATVNGLKADVDRYISIHALLAESDAVQALS